jgi:hypothetical protein
VTSRVRRVPLTVTSRSWPAGATLATRFVRHPAHTFQRKRRAWCEALCGFSPFAVHARNGWFFCALDVRSPSVGLLPCCGAPCLLQRSGLAGLGKQDRTGLSGMARLSWSFLAFKIVYCLVPIWQPIIGSSFQYAACKSRGSTPVGGCAALLLPAWRRTDGPGIAAFPSTWLLSGCQMIP